MEAATRDWVTCRSPLPHPRPPPVYDPLDLSLVSRSSSNSPPIRTASPTQGQRLEYVLFLLSFVVAVVCLSSAAQILATLAGFSLSALLKQARSSPHQLPLLANSLPTSLTSTTKRLNSLNQAINVFPPPLSLPLTFRIPLIRRVPGLSNPPTAAKSLLLQLAS